MEKAAPQPLAARGRDAPVGKGAASEDDWLHQTKPTFAWETLNEAMTEFVGLASKISKPAECM